MGNTHRFDIVLLAEDIALRGWLPADLARKAEVSHMAVYRFLDGRHQTPRTAKKLADALGYSVRRYLIRSKAVA